MKNEFICLECGFSLRHIQHSVETIITKELHRYTIKPCPICLQNAAKEAIARMMLWRKNTLPVESAEKLKERTL